MTTMESKLDEALSHLSHDQLADINFQLDNGMDPSVAMIAVLIQARQNQRK